MTIPMSKRTTILIVVALVIFFVAWEVRDHLACEARGGEMKGTGQHVRVGPQANQIEVEECTVP